MPALIKASLRNQIGLFRLAYNGQPPEESKPHAEMHRAIHRAGRRKTAARYTPHNEMLSPPKFGYLAAALLLSAAGLVSAVGAQDAKTPAKPIQTAKQAIRLGEGALKRKYGPSVMGERPFHAELKNQVWFVKGTTYCQEQLPSPTLYCPAWHWVRITQEDGRILETGEAQATNQ